MGDDVAGIYAATSAGLAFDVTGEPGDLVFSVEETVHLLFSDGRYRRDWPDRGPAGDLAADAAQHPRDWGRWYRAGAAIVVEPASGAPARFVAADGAILDENGRAYRRLSGRQPLALDGRWVRVDSVSDRPAIVFSADRFTTAGGLLGLVAMQEFVTEWGGHPPGPLFDWPDTGGDYALDRYTLTLSRDDGRVLRLLAVTAPPDRLRLGYTWFKRDDL